MLKPKRKSGLQSVVLQGQVHAKNMTTAALMFVQRIQFAHQKSTPMDRIEAIQMEGWFVQLVKITICFVIIIPIAAPSVVAKI